MEEGQASDNTGLTQPSTPRPRPQTSAHASKAPQGTNSGARRSSSPKGSQRKPARSASATKRSANTKGSSAPRGNWRHSDTTVFILGVLLIAVLVYCAAVWAMNHHDLSAWMVAAGFAIGVGGTLVLMDGSDE